MEIIGIIVLFILNVFLFFRSFRLISIIEELQEENLQKDEDVLSTLRIMLEEMRTIDLKGAFESDDEVGSVFNELKTIIEEYNKKLNG